MHGLIPLVAAAGLLLGLGAPAVAAPLESTSAAADAAPVFTVDAATIQGQGRGQGQARGEGRPEARGQAQGRGQAQAGAGGQGQARGQGQPAARGQAQGRAQGRAQGQGASGERGRSGAEPGRSSAAPGRSAEAPGRASAAEGRRTQRLTADEIRGHVRELPPPLRRLADSQRRSERMAVGAIARAKARGLDADRLDVRTENGIVRILSPAGAPLLELDERRARELGEWRVRRLGDRRPNGNSPAFCRSGEGHPVWGREWCLRQGFGLGSPDGTIWSRGGVDDVVFGRTDSRDRLDRGGLIDVLGDIVFGRLALHAVSLGYAEPLAGVWVAEPNGPRILRVRSGDNEVAELLDGDRDDRVEVLYVVQPRW